MLRLIRPTLVRRARAARVSGWDPSGLANFDALASSPRTPPIPRRLDSFPRWISQSPESLPPSPCRPGDARDRVARMTEEGVIAVTATRYGVARIQVVRFLAPVAMVLGVLARRLMTT